MLEPSGDEVLDVQVDRQRAERLDDLRDPLPCPERVRGVQARSRL